MKTSNIGFLINALQNAQSNGTKSIQLSMQSKQCISLLDCLVIDGWIERWNFIENQNQTIIQVFFKDSNSTSVINKIRMVSKPGRKVFISLKELLNNVLHLKKTKTVVIKQNHSNHFFKTLILSTSKGILTDKIALKHGVGGQLLVSIH